MAIEPKAKRYFQLDDAHVMFFLKEDTKQITHREHSRAN